MEGTSTDASWTAVFRRLRFGWWLAREIALAHDHGMADEMRVERGSTVAGKSVLRLHGRICLADGDAPWQALAAALAEPGAVAAIDVSGVEEIDGAGASYLLAWRARAAAAGAPIEITGSREDAARMLAMYGCPSKFTSLKEAPHDVGVLDQIGRNTRAHARDLREALGYMGLLATAVVHAVRRPSSVHWPDVPRLMERAGADGVPIVLLIDFLIGLIVSLQAAGQLARFGANVFVADLAGLAMARELAPLMTAIIVAGRSGAAFAAELGTMQVSEEIDALRTLGLDPQRHLVLPRAIALGTVVPLLTLLGMAVGIAGGLVVAITQLDLAPIGFFHELNRAMAPLDVVEGLVKSFVFAVLITFIACQRGLTTRGGAAGVGASTTSAVVATLFYLVASDAVLSTMFNTLRQ